MLCCLVVLGTYPVIIPLSGISLRAVRGLHRCESLLKGFCFMNKFVLWTFVYKQIPAICWYAIWFYDIIRGKTHFRRKKPWHVLLLPAGPSHAFYMMRRDPANQQAKKRSPLFPQSVIAPFKSEQSVVGVSAFKTHFQRDPLCRIHRVALNGVRALRSICRTLSKGGAPPASIPSARADSYAWRMGNVLLPRALLLPAAETGTSKVWSCGSSGMRWLITPRRAHMAGWLYW